MRSVFYLALVVGAIPVTVQARAYYMLWLAGPKKEFVTLKVDTRKFDGVVDTAKFTVRVSDGSRSRTITYSMLDNGVVAIKRGEVYQVFRRHNMVGAKTVELASGLAWAERALGDKSDGTESADAEAALSAKPTAISQPSGAPAGPAPKPSPDFCRNYAETAVRQQSRNIARSCGFPPSRWTDDRAFHYGWCVDASVARAKAETATRATLLEACR